MLLGLGAVAAVAGNPYRGPFARVDTKQLALDAGTQADHVTASQLADWLIEGRDDFMLVDVRAAADFAQYHIPTAVNVPLAGLAPDFAPRNERIVVYSDGGVHAAQAWLLLRAARFQSAYLLFEGLEGWKQTVLFPAALPANAAAKDQIDFARRAAIAQHFGGRPQTGGTTTAPAPAELPKIIAPPEPSPRATPAAPRKKKEGC